MPSADHSQTYKLFAYGTLAVPAITARVLGRKIDDLKFQDAILPGYTRHHVRGEDYPGIIDDNALYALLGKDAGQLSEDDRSVRGTVISGLTRKDMGLLDIFEGDEYKRITVEVTTLGVQHTKEEVSLNASKEVTGKTSANVYVWAASVQRLDPQIWSFAEFVRDKAEAWATVKDHEFATVETARGFSVDANGVVGKTAKGFPDFGHNMKQYWPFAPDWVNLNHGSYGSPPLPVLEAKAKLAREMDACIDVWMRRKVEPMLTDVRKQLAPMINAETDEVVIVPNATHGVNTVASNIDWKDGDVIVVYATTYNAVSQTMKYVCDRNPGVKLETILVEFPCYHSEIIEKTQAVLEKYNQPTSNVRGGSEPPVAVGVNANERVRMVVIDSIASAPGVVYPWEQVTHLCHKYGALSLVDAAHSIGQHHVDVKKADPDFFISNCHKWLMTHRGSALFYVPFRNQRLIRSSFPTGHYYESERYPMVGVNHPWKFVEQFGWNGTMDFTSYLTIPHTIKFRESIGGEDRIIAYNHSLAVAGGERLSKRWGTRVMDNDRGELTACMVNVELPNFPAPKDGNDFSNILRFIEAKLLFQFRTFASPMWHNNTWWARFSAQVWVEIEDFDYVADAYENIGDMIRAGDHLKPYEGNGLEIPPIPGVTA